MLIVAAFLASLPPAFNFEMGGRGPWCLLPSISNWHHASRFLSLSIDPFSGSSLDAYGVLVTPQWGRGDVAVVSQWCHSGGTVVAQWWHSGGIGINMIPARLIKVTFYK